MLETYRLRGARPVLVTRPQRRREDRRRAGARHPRRAAICEQFQPGEVLVTDKTDPDWEPIMKKAAAIVTNRGGRTCHAAIVSRELGMPGDRRHRARHRRARTTGQTVTVSCAEGETGFVYDGPAAVRRRADRPAPICRGRSTKIMMNVGNPDEAFSLSFLPNDGVGLARDGVHHHARYIKIHPLALLRLRPARRRGGDGARSTD